MLIVLQGLRLGLVTWLNTSGEREEVGHLKEAEEKPGLGNQYALPLFKSWFLKKEIPQ